MNYDRRRAVVVKKFIPLKVKQISPLITRLRLVHTLLGACCFLRCQMGSGTSVEAYPERLTLDECKEMIGGSGVFDLPKFNEMCDDAGTVSKREILAMADDDEEDMAAIAEVVEQNGIFFSFESFDADGSGGLTFSEFLAAAKSLGYHILPENAEKLCNEIDEDKDGIIDEEEFVKFVLGKVTPADGQAPMEPGAIYDHLGSLSAQHGYGTALAILKKRPEAARDKFPSNHRYKGSDWYPLHYILSQDVNGGGDSRAAAARARRLVATPVVQALIKAYPAASTHRCMEGVRFPKGHLPLELAVAKGWSADVVELILKAYPAAATILDPINDKISKDQPFTSLKGFRWMRKIAEKLQADDSVLALLPKPKLVDAKVTWISGKELAIAEAERLRLKAEKQAKLKSKLEAKRNKEIERQKQKRDDAKVKSLLERHQGPPSPP